jgi:mannose-6-phosphate isomerase-like protein (cupin superfamily)
VEAQQDVWLKPPVARLTAWAKTLRLAAGSVVSERLWIWYHNTDEGWVEPVPHLHESSDECFIVLQGRLLVEVEGEQYTVGPREFCCFPAGVYHRIVAVHTPAETSMLRSPLVTDKVYQHAEQEPPPRHR